MFSKAKNWKNEKIAHIQNPAHKPNKQAKQNSIEKLDEDNINFFTNTALKIVLIRVWCSRDKSNMFQSASSK